MPHDKSTRYQLGLLGGSNAISEFAPIGMLSPSSLYNDRAVETVASGSTRRRPFDSVDVTTIESTDMERSGEAMFACLLPVGKG